MTVRSSEPLHEPPHIDLRVWTSDADFANGGCHGVTVITGGRGIIISHPVSLLQYHDPFRNGVTYWDYGTWTSPVVPLSFGATRLVMSWNGKTPHSTHLITEIQTTMQNGERTPWLIIGNYAFFDTDIARASASPDARPYGVVETDTFLTYQGFTVRAYRVRIALCRVPGVSASPQVWRLTMLASVIHPRDTMPESQLGPASRNGIELTVPRYSQYVHNGQHKQYDGGGKSWCSPTSTQMVTEYWGKHPREEDLAWTGPGYQDPQVAYAARHTYDHWYQGTGNWAFNAAYASHYGLDAEIVQLPSMHHLERLIALRIPVVTALAFDQGEITGADYQTAGHLLVVTGFTRKGNVIVNDPASASNTQVRHVYDRRQFENAWLRTFWQREDGSTGYGTGGVAYIIKPHEMKLPPNTDPGIQVW